MACREECWCFAVDKGISVLKVTEPSGLLWSCKMSLVESKVKDVIPP